MEYKDAKKKFGEARSDKPVFVHVACYDRFENDREVDEKPWTEFDSAVIGFLADPSGVSCVRMAVIDEGKQMDTMSDFMEHPIFGDYFSIEPELLVVTDPHKPERMNDLYESFKQMHAEGGFLVYGMLYHEEPTVTDNLVYYQPVEGTAVAWDLNGSKLNDGSDVSSVDDAFKWLLENHPAYLEGITIMQNCPSGDWLRMGVPSNFVGYRDGTYENYQNRMDYAQEAADELGVKLGTERAEDILKTLREPVVEQAEEKQPSVSSGSKQSVVIPSVQPVSMPVVPTQPVRKPGVRQLPETPVSHTSTGGEEYQMS